MKTLPDQNKLFSFQSVLGALLLAGVFAFSVLMLTKVWPYMSYERGEHFLSTKTDRVLDNPWFLAGFYIHITSSLWVMAGGIPQFIPAVFRRKPAFHRWTGKIYVFSILFLAAPSGMILAFFANGGLPAKVGFSLQCIVWWLTTFTAWQEIMQNKWTSHVEWMIRSFAVTLAAVSLRSESYLLYYFFGTKPIETYLTVTWLSWTGNLLIAEILIRTGIAKRLVNSFMNFSEYA
ncbi:DUF2306 domain-containing protein [Xanthocytophaga agilis]|uniref:DUF2306 domain-containing protein n=1 Tax=Xanthocytophaga agilis TaxID=3048010 RepID=A0AAE3QXY2_9BACT|nr:DUF2306 domain-containing protein [Xanthocytophaga agilis]MDJ1499520.1 DUF2306 domain-containing protein [Xanthocytophaga agilis]